jgi:hypothetical protein|tara:strand:- start:1563 stop:2348 length:786 start_codon:yes stop_codon:yes gene_type:complete
MVNYIALQFTGLVRGFRFEHVRNNIYNRLIKPLQEQGFEVHIFWHTYDIEFDDIIYNIDKGKFNIKKIVVDKDQHIQNYLENDFKLLDTYIFPPTWKTAANVDTGTGKIVKDTYHHYGWFKYLYSIQEVNKIRNEYEKKQNIKYDWVINTQYQLSPQNTIDDLTKLNNKYMYSPGYARSNGYYDSFWISNVNDANYMRDFYKYMITEDFKKDLKITYLHNDRNYIDSEPLFKAYIDKNCRMKDNLNIRFQRVRYNGLIIDH